MSQKPCRFCGQRIPKDSFGAKLHEQRDCPERKVRCSICGGMFRHDLLRSHRAQCGTEGCVESCRFCGELVQTGSFLMPMHERTCHMQRMCDICGNRVHKNDFQAHRECCADEQWRGRWREQCYEGWGDGRQDDSWRRRRPLSSKKKPSWCQDYSYRTDDLPSVRCFLPGRDCSEADQVIWGLKRRMLHLRGEALKRVLRSYQLKWHPDKQRGNEDVASKVFLFVQQEWECHFKEGLRSPRAS